MANPSRQQIIEAYEALEELRDGAREQIGLTADAKYDTILEVLPSKPELTMADVEWNDDEHSLTEAIHPKYGRVPMLAQHYLNDLIGILIEDECGLEVLHVEPETLTPTGRKYELKEKNNG